MIESDESRLLEQLLNDSWNYHDQESARLACELEAVSPAAVLPRLLAPFIHLSIHTLGTHLGDWPRALILGKRIAAGHAPDLETMKAWGWLYVAAVLSGDLVEAADVELSYLKAAGDDFGAALLELRFMLAEALIGSKRVGEGARLYRRALDVVGQVQPSARLDRTIAVASNNLAWELYEMSPRTADESALMQLSAETSLKFWLKCGNWTNAERGHYLNALVANVTGNPEPGLVHADTALAIIAANGERPLDAALLHLARAVSLAALGDADGAARAIGDAEVTAAKLAATDLKARFAAERAKVVAAVL
ncbi:conserved hypothetical protein [Bradyrhizobium sp. STM 3843]|uniref:hypothetical protein n=1 Tax=Bradyrhizobium sp. STM 3843 TaxID=551947 RepID=UPI000240A8A8|nr:hypothetical protein [Bradyrhizobium sp. STM 3843]CCE04583.1 conserved hypothetical protein [Bradyrhizobium sp. STM 3843]